MLLLTTVHSDAGSDVISCVIFVRTAREVLRGGY